MGCRAWFFITARGLGFRGEFLELRVLVGSALSGNAKPWLCPLPCVSLLQDRMRTPVHQGALPDADAVGAVGNPACGDVVTIYLGIEDGMIRRATFESVGSVYQLATASVLCDCVLDGDLVQARERTPTCVLEKLPDLPQRHRYLARLAIEGLQRALAQFEGGDSGPKQDVDCLGEAEAQALVLGLFADGRRWSTREVEARVQAEGYHLPEAPVRFLSRLRRDGSISGVMNMEHRAWQWWLDSESGQV